VRARVGDQLMLDGDERRAGLIIGLQHEDGSPPYVVRWLASGHIALVFPGPFARIVPAGAGRASGQRTSNGKP
jgi:hypothetical protein